ncbi:MAG: YidC/Oxa1 family membrane protein insertase [Trebonia sp.]
MSVLLGVPVDAAYHLVFALTHLLTPVAGGLAAAAAIVLFTAAVRLLISPLSFRALRGQAAMARLAPQVQALRTRHRRQPERLQRELTALYKREGTGPFSGLLPLLVQWPFLSVMYLLFRSGTVGGGQNKLLSDGLFGVPLGAHWLSGAGLVSVHDVLFLAIFGVLAALCWLLARLAKRAVPAAVPAAAPAPGTDAARRVDRVPTATARPGRSRKGAAGQSRERTAALTREAATALTREAATAQARTGTAQLARGAGRSAAGASPDPAEALASSKAAALLTRVLPYVTVVIAAFAPLAAAIYLLTTVGWTVAERRLFLRRTARGTGITAPETR